MRCNLAFGLTALLAATVFSTINPPVFSTASAPENTIASNGQCCDPKTKLCIPCPDENY